MERNSVTAWTSDMMTAWNGVNVASSTNMNDAALAQVNVIVQNAH
jgi:hypothetical protein